MQYSQEFKDLVISGYYCNSLTGEIIKHSDLDTIKLLLEDGNNNIRLDIILKDGAMSLNNYFTSEEILKYLKVLNLDFFRQNAIKDIIIKQAYFEWLQKCNDKTQKFDEQIKVDNNFIFKKVFTCLCKYLFSCSLFIILK